MKKALVFLVSALLAIAVVGCGKSKEQQALDDTYKVMDSVVPGIADQSESGSGGSTPTQQPTDTPAPTPEKVSLNLPFSMQEQSFVEISSGYNSPSNSAEYISSDGNLHEITYTYNVWKVSEDNIIDSDVLSIYAYGDDGSKVVFYIKNDNTLWAYGSNKDGRLGDGTGVDRDKPVQILDDVATVGEFKYGSSQRNSSGYENASPAFYAIKTDKSFYTWGVNNEYSPTKVIDGIIRIRIHR